jgi:hypothetical protein
MSVADSPPLLIVVGRCGGLSIFPYNSRFGAFNSRLGWTNSRFRLLWEFAGKRLICLTVIATKRRFHWEIDEIPGFDRKNRKLRPSE